MAKWKKKLKKAAKVAVPLLGALALAKGLGRKKATNAPGNAFAKARRAMTQDTPYPDAIMRGGVGVKSGKTDPYADYDWSGKDEMWMKGGGIAKRGTGVALKSGGRVKSMGIAKRGGGVAKR